MTKMYAATVYEHGAPSVGSSLRGVYPTMKEAKAGLDAEVKMADKPALAWTDEFGGSTARQGFLTYDVVPVEVTLPDRTGNRHYDHNVTVDHSAWDAALEVSVWSMEDFGSKERVLRIPVEDIPDFVRDVTQHGLRSLSTAARRIEVGHCETCGNTGLVDTEVNGRKSNTHCPDCKDRWPAEPFKSAPTIGRLEKRDA